MALDRFSNIKEIQETNGVVRGIDWNTEDLDILQLDIKGVTPRTRPTVEIHLYTIGEESLYITGGCIEDFEVLHDKLHVNYGKACEALGIERGQFEVVINVYRDLLGSKEEPDLYIKEISEDRREVWLQSLPNTNLDINQYLNSFGQGTYTEKIYQTEVDADGAEVQVFDSDGQPIVLATEERPLSDDIALNLGNNSIYRIINQKDWNEENDFVVRLYKPLADDIETKTKLWTIEQLSDSYIDNINLIGPEAIIESSRTMLGPNFDIDVTKGTITETDFQSWNQLLDANTSTSQQIIDRIFSGSIGNELNIDYSGMQNFVHFSSAKERVDNFKYKLGLIEYYDRRVITLDRATGTDNNSLQGNIITNRRRKDDVVGSFDGFERWLYNEPTSSLFTDQAVYNDNNNIDGIYGAEGGFLGAKKYRLEAWPKYLSGSKYYLHHITSSLGTSWYNGWSASASFFDTENNNSLVNTIPEHIRLDPNNSEYELFVNMIGHHFDILYSHIENLTKVSKPEEHFKLGQNKDTLYQVAKSMGWTLENGKQASQLWQYKLGIDSGSGAYQTTGSLFSKSDEAITTEVWRRIVNNLPYLLKTKGTTRSIKALMNTFGIPQTLLSIREYGGPKVDEDTPTLIEDRFSYALKFNSGSNQRAQIKFARGSYSSSIGGWGLPDNYDTTNLDGADANERPPDTIEFRFKPAIKHSMLLLSHASETTTDNVYWNLGVEYTGSYSGSDKYGRLFMQYRGRGGDVINGTITTYSEYAPLFDGEFWNTRLWTAFPFVTSSFNTGNNKPPIIYYQAQKASDYITDKVVHRTSGSLYPGSGSNAVAALASSKYWSRPDESGILYLGGETGSGLITPLTLSTYSGSIQEYREWMEIISQKTFDLHTTNPSSYVSSISPTSSFDTLVRHYPFGTDLNAIDHSQGAGLFVSSSHPNSTLTDFSPPYPDGNNAYASASQFSTPFNTERGNYEPVEETYYVQGVSLGGNVPRSQKIRLEENELVRRLSPKASGEKSRFDRSAIDSNKLGLFYSPADQINKDIFNHVGDVALDDFVGDPDHEITYDYPDLSSFSQEYWKKYSDKNDLNAYLRVFSQFDFALFNQIKQLLPERIDESMGLIIEPHALERAKVLLTNRPEKEPLHYDAVITDTVATASGVIRPLSASIPMVDNFISGNSIYHKLSNGYIDTGNYLALLTGSQGGLPGGNPYEATTYKYEYTLFPYTTNPHEAAALNLPRQITGSLSPLTYSPTGSVILKQRLSTEFDAVVYHYGTGSNGLSKYARNWNKATSMSLGLSFSQSLTPLDGYRDDFFMMTENARHLGCKLTGPGVNINSTINAIDRKPVIEVFETNPNTLIYKDEPNAANPGNLEVR